MIMVSCYMTGAPERIDGTVEEICRKLQEFADSKKTRVDRPGIGPLHFMKATPDEIIAYFDRNEKRVLFARMKAD